MSLSGTWLRQAFGAAGVSAGAPLAVLVGATLLAAGWGAGGLGSLGQIASGPELPSAEALGPTASGRLADTRVSSGAGIPAVPSAAAGGAAGSTGGTLTGTPGVGAPTAPGSPGNSPVARIRQPTGTSPQTGAVSTPPSSGGGGGGPPATGPLESVGGTAGGLTRMLPGPISPLPGDLLDTLPAPPQ